MVQEKRGDKYLVPQLLVLVVLLARPLPLHGHHQLAHAQSNRGVRECGVGTNATHTIGRLVVRRRTHFGPKGHSIGSAAYSLGTDCSSRNQKRHHRSRRNSVITERCSASEELPGYIIKRGLRKGEPQASVFLCATHMRGRDGKRRQLFRRSEGPLFSR